MVNHRTALVSQMRGLLLDRGFALAKSITCARRLIPQILANFDNELTAMARDASSSISFETSIDESQCSTRKPNGSFSTGNRVSALPKIKGIGPKTATAIVAAIGDGSEFKNGRHLAAWVGLVPRQFVSVVKVFETEAG